jgi:spermidine synthase
MERFLSPMMKGGRCIGILYAINTLGAVAGTLLSTFIIAPALGFRATLLIFATLNLLCGVAVLFIERRVQNPPAIARQKQTKAEPTLRLYATIFFTGLLGIGYEVLGVRVLAQVLENTIYSFAAALSVYLLGTAIGAALYQRLGQRAEFRALLSPLLCGLSTSCVLGVFLLSKSQTIYNASRAALVDSQFGVLLAEMTMAAIVFGLPTIFMGAVFSLLVQSARREDGGVGRAVALNTLGSALAPALFGVLLLPTFGAKWALVLTSLGYLLLLPRLTGWQWVVVTLPVGLVFALPSQLQLVQKPPGGEVVEFREGVMDSVVVVKHFDGNRSLLVNNRFTMGGTGAANAERRHAHLPLLLHPGPKRALFLGLGTGITFGAAHAHPGLQADGVELVPEIIDVLHHFEPANAAPNRQANLKIYVADARRFVRVTEARYDVIVADLFHPARDGAGALYTVEHFQAIRNRLASGGLFCQWLPLFQLDEPMLRVIVRTFLEVFPNCRAYLLRFNVDTPVLGLVGTLESTPYPAGWFEKRVRDATLREQLQPLPLVNDFQLFGSLIAGTSALRSFAQDAPLNPDNRPVVIFGAPRFSYQRNATAYGRLLNLLNLHAADPRELMQATNHPDTDRFVLELKDFISARDVYLRGLVAESEGRMPQAIDAFVESARISREFSTGYAHCLTIAMQQAKSHPEAARALLQRLVAAQPDRPVAKELLKQWPDQ